MKIRIKQSALAVALLLGAAAVPTVTEQLSNETRELVVPMVTASAQGQVVAATEQRATVREYQATTESVMAASDLRAELSPVTATTETAAAANGRLANVVTPTATAERTASVATPLSREATAQAKMSGPVAALAAQGGDQMVDLVVRYAEQPEMFDDARVAELGGEVVRSFEVLEMRAIRLPADALVDLAVESSVSWLSEDSVIAPTSLASRVAASRPASNNVNHFYTGHGVGIAVIDTGVDAHSDLAAGIAQYDFAGGKVPSVTIKNGVVTYSGKSARTDEYGHGTHVAGIIAGALSATGDAEGLAQDADIVSLRVLGENGKGSMSDVVAAMDWLLEYGHHFNVRVVNLSLGMMPRESAATDPLVLAAERLWDAGFVVVAAAGNDGYHGNMTINSPGNSRKIITVGSLTDNGTGSDFSDDYVSSFSSQGPTVGDLVLKPDLLAPGNKVIAANSGASDLSVLLGNSRIKGCKSWTCQEVYLEMSGTSMAAPIVAATAARMLDKQPWLTPSTIKARLMRSARKLTDEPTAAGAGVLNINAAMNDGGVVNGQALSPLMVRDTQTGNVFIEDTADLWGHSQWAAGFIYHGGFGWADGVAPSITGDISANGFLWTDDSVWSRGFMWTDEGGGDVFSRGFMWTDEGTTSARSLLDDGGNLHDDP
ncbi:MAG: S8 family peptidase [Pseudomonadota bacterium]